MNTTEDLRSVPLALIAAGGSGERLGSSGPKALVSVGGRTLLGWCLEAFCASCVSRVAVAVVESSLDLFEEAVEPARSAGLEVLLVSGGASRSESVRNALAGGRARWFSGVTNPSCVLVHDAARPLVSASLIDACVDGLGSFDALVPAAAVVDTVKVADGDGVVSATLDRGSLWAVQTPQAFSYAALAAALDSPDSVLAAATDDASLIEAGGGRVKILPWDGLNVKVTVPADLAFVGGMLEG